MTVPQKNSLLVIAILAGVISLPMTWMTIYTQGMTSSFDFNAMNGYTELLYRLPIWLVTVIALVGCVFQLTNNLAGFEFPRPLLWLAALFALTWILIPMLLGMASGRVTPGIGWMSGVVCATISTITMLVPERTVRKNFASASEIK